MSAPGSYQQGDEHAPGSDTDYAFDGWVPENVRGKLTQDAPLDKLVWFKSGGAADWLFEPADLDDLVQFLSNLDEGTPVMAQVMRIWTAMREYF